MDRAGEWRLLDADEPEPEAASDSLPPKEEPGAASMRWLVAVVGVVVVGLAGIAIWLTMPQPDVRLDVGGRAFQVGPGTRDDVPLASERPAPSAINSTIVVDVQGAVRRPGVHRLTADSRVGDAIHAAGGYGPSVDIAAAAALLNLAERLVDGAKIHVPVLGEPTPPGPPPAGRDDTTVTGALIDINHATADELDTLPGIGEVTAAKIIAEREEMPFASIEELIARDVVGPATMDKIRELITVTP